MLNIEVNGKVYRVNLAITDEEKEKGLQGMTELPDDQGILFCYKEPQEVSFWMEETYIPLDIIFIDEYGDVISTKKGEPNDKTPLSENNVSYVLEVNQGSGIKEGDEIDLSEVEEEELNQGIYDEDTESEEVKTTMIVIGNKGIPQMELSGGERIFSRPHTKTLVRLSKKSYKSKKDSDYKMLGRKVFQYIEKQDTQDPQYTQLSTKE